MCIHAHPDIPSASGKMTETLCSICVTSMSLGSSMDLNITHSYACPTRWSFSNWPRLWLEGSHGRVGKLDRRWGASDRGREGEGEAAALMTKGDLLHWGQSQPDWGVQSSPRAGLLRSWGLSHAGRRRLAWSLPWPVWDSWSWGTHLEDAWDGFGELAGSGSSSSRWHCGPEQQTSGVCHSAWMNSFYCHWLSWIPGA